MSTIPINTLTWCQFITALYLVSFQVVASSFLESGPCTLNVGGTSLRNTLHCQDTANTAPNVSVAEHIQNLMEASPDDTLIYLSISDTNTSGSELDAVFESCKQIASVHLSRLSATALKNNSFQNCHMLDDVFIDTVPLSTMSENNVLFSNLTSIKKIFITDTQLSSLKTLTQPLSNELQSLTFEKSRVGEIPQEFCSNYKHLQRLFLAGNSISQIPVNCFNHMTNLNWLSLASNPIQTLPRHSLANSSIVFLDLGNCGLETIEEGAFAGADHLHGASLNDNKLTSIPVSALRDVPQLQQLTLSGNQITQLPADAFRGLTKLQSIDLNNCGLRTVDNKAFQGLSNIKNVLVGYNKDLQFKKHQRLTGLENVNAVSFKGCKLTHIPRELLPWYKIRAIYLNDNSWDCDCTLDWFPAMLHKRAQNRYTYMLLEECTTPLRLHKARIETLTRANFTCDPIPDPVLLFREFEEEKSQWYSQAVQVVVPVTVVITLVILATAVVVYRVRHSHRSVSQEETEQRQVLASTIV